GPGRTRGGIRRRADRHPPADRQPQPGRGRPRETRRPRADVHRPVLRPRMDGDDLRGALERRLGALWGRTVTVEGPARLSAGASRETWAFSARRDDGEPVRLVLRRDPPGQREPDVMAREAAVLPEARAHGVPVPELV